MAEKTPAAAEGLRFSSEWSVYETGTGVTRSEYEKAREGGGVGKGDKVPPEHICRFGNMQQFAEFYTSYPKPAAFFQTYDTTRHTLREEQSYVVQVSDVYVLQSHMKGKFEDPAFTQESEDGVKTFGSYMRINRINTAEALDAIWSALLFQVVGDTLLPNEPWAKRLVACVRAKDQTNKKKRGQVMVPNYRIELWFRAEAQVGPEQKKIIEQAIDALVTNACTDPAALAKIICKPIDPMPEGGQGGGGGGRSFRRGR